MNYRHAYHAGNFADVAKHALLAQCLKLMGEEPLRIVDTHAGAGVYDLTGAAARKSGEAEQGIVRLAGKENAPVEFAPLLKALRDLNPGGGTRVYPGSPALICGLLGAKDRLDACELRPDDFSLLSAWLTRFCPRGTAHQSDGFAFAAAAAAQPGRLLVHIDPPYEQSGDYERCIDAALTITARRPDAVVMIWTPLKDLETFDRFLRGLEARRPPPTLVAEVRLRPLFDPMAMNGCALVTLNPPAGLDAAAEAICGWTAQTLGGAGAKAPVWRLSAN